MPSPKPFVQVACVCEKVLRESDSVPSLIRILDTCLKTATICGYCAQHFDPLATLEDITNDEHSYAWLKNDKQNTEQVLWQNEN